MVGDDLGHQRQAQAAAAALGADEGLEQMVHHVEWHPGPLSRTSTVIGSSRRARLLLTATRRPCWYWVARVMVSVGRRRRLGGVLDQVQEHLDQPVAIPLHLGQRRIVELDDA